MRCPNCGAEQPEAAKFCGECGFSLVQPVCPHCGGRVSPGDRYCGVCGAELLSKGLGIDLTETPEAGKEPVRTTAEAAPTETEPTQVPKKHGRKTGGKTRKRWKPVLIAALALVVVAGGGFTAWRLLGSNDAQLMKAANNYAEVNEALLAVTTADGYDDLTTAEKAEQVLSALDDLADEGKVLADSVGYDESYPLVCYSYADGAYGGVMLEGFASDTFGIGGESYDTNIYKDEERGWVFDPWPSVPTFGTDASPYESDLSALVVCDLGDGYEKYLEYAQSLQSGWNEAYLDTTLVEDGALSFFRTGLSGYDLIVIWEHGEVYPGTYGEQTVIILQEVAGLVDDSNTSHSSGSFSDWQDLHENRIGQVTDGTYYYYFLMPSFFSYYYGDGQLADSIIWFGGCYGYYNDALVSVLADCGAKAVLGASNSVVGSYDFMMLDAFVYMQLCGKTVEESLTFAEQTWGANDWIFAVNRNPPNAEEAAGAEIHWYNGGDETLVTLTAEAQEIAQQGICSGTVIDAADSSLPIVGATITVTDADGTTTETTTDETGAFELKLYLGTYAVQIEMEGYQSVSSEVTVVAGESTDILISLPAEISDADARAAYWAFLYDEGYADDITDEFSNPYDDGLQYAMYDLNGDGISELLLHCYVSGISGTYYIYGYDGDVFFIGSCDNFNREGTYYSADENTLVIVSSGGADWITYEFYDVSDQLTLTYTMGHQFFGPDLGTVTEDNPLGYEIWSFYITEAGSEQRTVTEEEWNSYIDNLTEIDLLDSGGADTSNAAEVCDIVLDTAYANNHEFGNIYAYDSNGNLVWFYETGSYPATELTQVYEIGLRDGCYYFVESGTVVAMDAETGEILWENDDFGGSGSAAFAENCICLAGYYGPCFYAVSYDGTTLCRINIFDTEYYWPYISEVQGNEALVCFDSTYPATVFRVNLDTWEYAISDAG